MNPGRELDAEVAKKVLGLEVVKTTRGKNKQRFCYTIGEPSYYDEAGEMKLDNPLPSYSEEIGPAMEVFEYLRKSHKWCCLKIRSDYCYNWEIVLTEAEPWPTGKERFDGKGGLVGVTPYAHVGKLMASSESLPEAICLAALKAVKEEK